jgi:predicted RNase H-like nuclease (RuvC/YqgF family)
MHKPQKGIPMHGQRFLSIWFAGILLVASLLASTALRAEFYRYTGADGAIHFTDDLSQVPPDQREKIETFSESETAPPPQAVEKDPSTEAADRAKEAVTFLEEKRQALVSRQEKLKAEYDRLMKERADIESLRKAADTPEKRKALQTKITDLQTDITAYETQTKALDEEVNAFNQAVKAGSTMEAQPQ